MPKPKKSDKRPIVQYDHKGKERVNNPPAGLAKQSNDPYGGQKLYAYDSHPYVFG